MKYQMFELDDNMRRKLRSKVYEDLHDSEMVYDKVSGRLFWLLLASPPWQNSTSRSASLALVLIYEEYFCRSNMCFQASTFLSVYRGKYEHWMWGGGRCERNMI